MTSTMPTTTMPMMMKLVTGMEPTSPCSVPARTKDLQTCLEAIRKRVKPEQQATDSDGLFHLIFTYVFIGFWRGLEDIAG